MTTWNISPGSGVWAPDQATARMTDRARRVVQLALREALQLGHNYVGTEHILLALIREGEGVAAKVLVDRLDLELKDVRAGVIEYLTEAREKPKPHPLQAQADALAAGLADLRKQMGGSV